MDWRKELNKYEVTYDWEACIKLLDLVKSNLSQKDKLDFTVRILFLITYWFLEGNYSEDDEKKGIFFSQKIFDESLKEFNNNSDYLFCISVITRLNEYIFDVSIEQSEEFIYNAILLSPECELYRDWLFIYNKQLMLDLNEDYYLSSFIIDWKNSKGLLGKYVVDFLISKIYNRE
jgi:hypothetical protein